MRTHYLRSAVAYVTLGLAATATVAQESDNKPSHEKPEPTAIEWNTHDQRVYDELAKAVEVAFSETPLEEVVEFIGERSSIPVLIDTGALEVLGHDASSPITFRQKGTALQDTLRTLLRPFDLTYVVRNGVLIITSSEEAEQELVVRVFPVGDIVENAGALDRLVSVLTSVVQPDTWEEAGGAGSLHVLDGMLVVDQTAPVLQELQDALAILRSKVGTVQRTVLSPARAFDGDFAKAMAQPSELDFFETSLADCAEVIADAIDLPVAIDGTACDLLGIDASQPITFSMDGITLGAALDAILREHNLAVIPRDGAVVFTSVEQAEQELFLRGYYIGDFVRGISQQMGSDDAAAEQVINALTATVDPDSWEQVGGQGAVQYWPSSKLMLVSQSHDVHQKLARVMDQIATVRDGAHATLKSGAEEPVIEVYVLPQTAELSAERVARLIQLYLHDVNWDSNSIQTLADRVVVRHTPRVQRRVRTLVYKLVHGREPSQRNSKAGGGGIF